MAATPFEAELVALLPTLRLRARRFVKTNHEAADLVQDTVLRCLERRHQYTPGTDLAAWAATIMHNRFCTQRRDRLARGEAMLEDLPAEIIIPPAKPPQIDRIALREAVGHLKALSPDRRRAVIGIRLFGLSYERMAAALNAPIGTLQSRVHRGTAQLVAMAEGVAA